MGTTKRRSTQEKQRNIKRKHDKNEGHSKTRDMFLFHANEDEYIEQSTSQTLACWISSHRKEILNSVKKWATTAQSGSTGIIGWMRGEENNGAKDRIHARQRQEFF
jgi:hypothetical protein